MYGNKHVFPSVSLKNWQKYGLWEIFEQMDAFGLLSYAWKSMWKEFSVWLDIC